MLKTFIRQSLWASLVILSAVPNSSQERREKGVFIIYQSSTPAGKESYEIKHDSSAIIASGEVNISLPELRLHQKPVLKLNNQLEPSEFSVQATVNGKDLTMSFIFAGGNAKVQTQMQDRTRMEDVPYQSGTVLLANNVFHHAIIMIRKYCPDEGGIRTFTAFPKIPVTIEDHGDEAFKVNNETVKLRRLFVNIGGQIGETVWIDSNKRIIRISIPMQSLEVVLSGYEQIITQTGKPTNP